MSLTNDAGMVMPVGPMYGNGGGYGDGMYGGGGFLLYLSSPQWGTASASEVLATAE